MNIFHCHSPILSGVCAPIMLILFFISVNCNGQGSPDQDYEVIETHQSLAPVIIDGRIVFYVNGIASIPADQRADAISSRIVKAASDSDVTKDSVKSIALADRNAVFAGRYFIMNVYDLDAEKLKINRNLMSDVVVQKVRTAIESYRYERSRPAIIRKLIYAAGALLLMVALIFLLKWLVRKLEFLLESRIQARINSVEYKSYHLIRSDQLWKTFHVFFRALRFVAILLVIAGFLQYVLGLFPWTNHIASYVIGIFLDPVTKIGMGVLGFLPSLAFLIVIYIVARYLLKLMKLLFKGIQEGGIKIPSFDPDWALSTYKIMRLIVLIFAVVIAYPYIPGSSTDAFKGISVFLGLLISLGSSSFISNIIAGYSMTYRGAFKRGDRISVNEITGIVEEQKLMVTRLRSLKNEDIIIPNSTMLNSNIINYSIRAKTDGLIIHTIVGIGYETPWRLVDAMLKMAAERTEGVLKIPPPFVIKQSLGDFAVNYEINAFIEDVSRMPHLYNALHQNILDVFNENNIQIMTPAYEGDPEIPKVVPKEQWNIPPATSSNV